MILGMRVTIFDVWFATFGLLAMGYMFWQDTFALAVIGGVSALITLAHFTAFLWVCHRTSKDEVLS